MGNNTYNQSRVSSDLFVLLCELLSLFMFSFDVLFSNAILFLFPGRRVRAAILSPAAADKNFHLWLDHSEGPADREGFKGEQLTHLQQRYNCPQLSITLQENGEDECQLDISVSDYEDGQAEPIARLQVE